MKRKSKHAGRILASCVIFLGSLVGSANADTLKIYNNLNSSIPVMRAQHKIGASEGYNGAEDASYLNPPSGTAGIYSNLDNGAYKLSRDARPMDSNTPYDIKLIYNGTLASPTENHLSFELFSEDNFGNKPILFQSDRMPYGPVVDVRRAIAQNSGNLPLIDLEAGTYSLGTPYNTTDSNGLTIGTRLLGDLNDSNDVDFKDFAELANNFGKPQGQYVADICGPNGIPDGYIDNYDLAAFCEDWLKDINDPSTW